MCKKSYSENFIRLCFGYFNTPIKTTIDYEKTYIGTVNNNVFSFDVIVHLNKIME